MSPSARSGSSRKAKSHSLPERALELARLAARRIVRRKTRVLRLSKSAYKKIERRRSIPARAAQDLRTLARLAQAWALRKYRRVPWRSITYVVAAILYFINPLDLLPDMLIGIGFVDDAAVVHTVVRSLHGDLEAFRAWESEDSAGEPAQNPEPPAAEKQPSQA